MNDKTNNQSSSTQSREAATHQPDHSQQLLRGMAALSLASQQAVNGSVTDVVGGWLAAQYAGTLHAQLNGAEGPRRWEILRACVQDWSKLRHGDHVSARLQLVREQLASKRVQNQAAKETEFREWLKRPDIRQELFPKPQADTRPSGRHPEPARRPGRKLDRPSGHPAGRPLRRCLGGLERPGR